MAQYKIPPVIALAKNNNIAGVRNAPTYTNAIVRIGPYTLQRQIANGTAIFPLDDIMQLIAKDGNAATSITLMADSTQVATSPIYVLNGASERAMQAVDESSSPVAWPQPSKIIVFPAFDYNEEILIDSYTGSSQDVVFTDVETGRQATYSRTTPLFYIPMTFFRNFGSGTRRLKVQTGSEKTGYLTVAVNDCDRGVFTRWIDAAGLQRYYLWRQTEQVDDVSVDNTYETLSENLSPERHRTITSTTTYSLHSGLVDRAVFDLCTSILSGRKVQIYDTERQEWVSAYVEDGDVSRSNAPMQDCAVELSIDHLTV